MKRLLSEDGSIYVHLDWHVGHYVKVMMDEVFGRNNFINEIIWQKLTAAKSQSKKYPNIHDSLFVYAKSQAYTFNIPYNKRVAAFTYKNKVWLRGLPERTGKVLLTVAKQFEKGGIEELETTNLFDEEEIIRSGSLDALMGLNIQPQVLIQETKARLLA